MRNMLSTKYLRNSRINRAALILAVLTLFVAAFSGASHAEYIDVSYQGLYPKVQLTRYECNHDTVYMDAIIIGYSSGKLINDLKSKNFIIVSVSGSDGFEPEENYEMKVSGGMNGIYSIGISPKKGNCWATDQQYSETFNFLILVKGGKDNGFFRFYVTVAPPPPSH